MIEPGRSVIADAGICLTTVRNVKSRPTENKNTEFRIQKSEFRSQNQPILRTSVTGAQAPSPANASIEASRGKFRIQNSEFRNGRFSERHDWSAGDLACKRFDKKRQEKIQNSEYRIQRPILRTSVTGAQAPSPANAANAANAAKKASDIEPRTLNIEHAEHWLLTDAGFNILLSMETYKWYYHLIHASRTNEPHDFPYKVAGPLCDGGDVYFDIEGEKRLPDHRYLPPETAPGELLALLNTGAYTVAQMFPYNGRTLPKVVLADELSK